MRWEEFLERVKGLPLIELNSFIQEEPLLRVQASRWLAHGKIIKVKSGVYLLAERYRKIELYEPYLASVLKRPSYISLEKALEYHNLIPEAVTVFTSVTTKRQASFVSEAGRFEYRHLKPTLFFGYKPVTVRGQTGFVAEPEKALLDFLYLKAPRFSREFIEELRLQNTASLDLKKLFEYAQRFRKKDILNYVNLIAAEIKIEKRRR